MWLSIFSEHGLPGFLVWVSILGYSFLSLRDIRAYGLSNPKANWVVTYGDMVRTALISFLVNGTFLDIAYFELFYFLIVVVILLKECVRKMDQKTTSERNVFLESYPAIIRSAS